MMFPLMTFFFPSPPQRPRGSRKERPVPDVFQAPQRGKPVGGAREFPVGALQPLQHPWKDLPVWELPVFRQPGRKPVPCHHSNARGNAKQRRHYFVLENTAKKKKKKALEKLSAYWWRAVATVTVWSADVPPGCECGETRLQQQGADGVRAWQEGAAFLRGAGLPAACQHNPEQVWDQCQPSALCFNRGNVLTLVLCPSKLP